MNGNNEIQKNEALLAKLKGLQSAIKEVRYDDGYNINQISGIGKNAVIHLKSLTTSDSDDATYTYCIEGSIKFRCYCDKIL